MSVRWLRQERQHLLQTHSTFSKSVMVAMVCPSWGEWTRFLSMLK